MVNDEIGHNNNNNRNKKSVLLKITTKPTPIVVLFALAIAAVLSIGYIMALAILAPQQLAEATAAASDLVCSGCVGTSDVADSAVTSAKIGSLQVGTSDIASSAVTSSKISDTAGVQSVDIRDGQVRSLDIADGTITSTDIANDAIVPNVQIVYGVIVEVAPGEYGQATADCPAGTILSGGGYRAGLREDVMENYPLDQNTWLVYAINNNPPGTVGNELLIAYALCIGPSP